MLQVIISQMCVVRRSPKDLYQDHAHSPCCIKTKPKVDGLLLSVYHQARVASWNVHGWGRFWAGKYRTGAWFSVRVQGSGFMVEDKVFRVWGVGCRV